MAWRRPVALAVLLALTTLPVAGTLCALLCESASAQNMARHGAGEECERPSRPPVEPQLSRLSGAAGHDCSTHDASMQPVAPPAAARADLTAKAAPGTVISPDPGETVVLRELRIFVDYAAPPGTAPPTVRPAVLRV